MTNEETDFSEDFPHVTTLGLCTLMLTELCSAANEGNVERMRELIESVDLLLEKWRRAVVATKQKKPLKVVREKGDK